jgi:hypothetical protein
VVQEQNVSGAAWVEVTIRKFFSSSGVDIPGSRLGRDRRQQVNQVASERKRIATDCLAGTGLSRYWSENDFFVKAMKKTSNS